MWQHLGSVDKAPTKAGVYRRADRPSRLFGVAQRPFISGHVENNASPFLSLNHNRRPSYYGTRPYPMAVNHGNHPEQSG